MPAMPHALESKPKSGVELDIPFRAAFQSSRTAMLMIDPHRQGNPIVFVNDAFSRLTGYSREETLGRNCRFLHGADTDQATAGAIDAALQVGNGIETEILNYRKDGSSFWNSLVISPVEDDDGGLRYFLASQQDVSAKKQAEAELNRTKHNLEEEVERRTKDLQSALDQKTSLLHEVDHRVKNSLQVISSIVLLKARRIQNQEARRVLGELSERISALSTVHRLLYSAGDVSRFDLSDFTIELVSELVASLPPGQVELDLKIAPVGVPAARAASLALLLNELIGNAVKHAFPDGRKGILTIQIGKIENGLQITVEDDGVGLHHSPAPEGSFGKTLIDILVRQSRGQLVWIDKEPGTRAVIVMPMDAEETQF
ncbi:PAS domain S-box protein [Microvirga sp. 2TAF3]|uniref:PAS domain S-box protein n=1 Tax=Microvirga sp. 2TAF3 TaxID=3233014 RepID=UPI003F9DA09B